MASSFRIGIAVLLLAWAAAPAAAEIYRWEDGQGTIHYTDDLTNVPPEQRKNATVIIREPREPASAPSPAAPPDGVPPKKGRMKPANAAPPAAPPPDSAAALRQEISQLRARIAAKENLIRAVDEKRSLATNPLRNRVVDPGDLDLYGKYKAELPADREQLRDLESRLSAFGTE